MSNSSEPETCNPDGERDSDNKPFDCPMCGRCIKSVSDVCEPCITTIYIQESVKRFNRAYYSYRRLNFEDTP